MLKVTQLKFVVFKSSEGPQGTAVQEPVGSNHGDSVQQLMSNWKVLKLARSWQDWEAEPMPV